MKETCRVLVNSEEVKEMKAADLMSTLVIATRPKEDVEHAARIMPEKRIKKLPVIENGEFVGVVTLTDLFRFEPELNKSYTVLMRARTESNGLHPSKLKAINQ